MRALISVSDKTGVVELARQLIQSEFEIISTGGTAKSLREANLAATEVSEVTGFAEILGGRVKTLHPKIFGGILFRRGDAKHKSDIENLDIPAIDWVVVNLYPFEKINLENRLSKAEMLEFIDIGGVALLRAAAKNFNDIVVLCDSKDYLPTVQELNENKTISMSTRKMLAAKAFAHTAHYDSMIARFFKEEHHSSVKPIHPQPSDEPILFPKELTIGLKKVSDLRYGENPHQKAALYKESGERDWGVVNAEKLQGKELSFNNYLDLDTAWQIVNSFNLSQSGQSRQLPFGGAASGVCCAIIKHTNPCGVAIGKDALESYQLAYGADSVSAFGGVIGFSSTVDKETAAKISECFYECMIAPDYTAEALDLFKKKPNLRILRQNTTLTLPYELDIKKISGGILLQERDLSPLNSRFFSSLRDEKETAKAVTKRAPSPVELYSLEFSWKMCKFVKSNAIVLARGTVTAGIGAGQMNRIDSLKIALQKSIGQRAESKEQKTKNKEPLALSSKLLASSSQFPLVMASDAFFPFRDCVDEAAKSGITAIIQPGGSIRDQESIDAANEHNIAMIFTGMRHFRH